MKKQVTGKDFINSFYLVGRIVDTADMTKTSNGVNIARLHLSVERLNKDQEVTNDIFEIVLFRSLAERSFKEGQVIAISGKLQANNYVRDGVIYYNNQLIASSIYVME